MKERPKKMLRISRDQNCAVFTAFEYLARNGAYGNNRWREGRRCWAKVVREHIDLWPLVINALESAFPQVRFLGEWVVRGSPIDESTQN